MLLLAALLVLQGCGFARFLFGGGTQPDDPGCSDPLATVAYWVTLAGGLAIAAAGVVGYLTKSIRLAGTIALAGLGGIVTGRVLAWIGAHSGLFVGIVFALGIAGVVWWLRRNPKKVAEIEEATGIDLPDSMFPPLPKEVATDELA